MDNQVQEHKILTFKEVHKELEMENNLLLKEHNVEDFAVKSNFLTSVGFTNSKATKMYQAIVSSEEYRKDFNRRYNGLYKFILTEQLERVCEKYNLYVRPLEFFADIPEKNIKDMMDFKFYIEDLIFIPDSVLMHYLDSSRITLMYDSNLVSPYDAKLDYVKENRKTLTKSVLEDLKLNTTKRFSLSEIKDISNNIVAKIVNKYYSGNSSHFSSTFRSRRVNIIEGLQIAAVENLFTPQAFQKSKSRILENEAELIPTGQVDLDPIVMLKNNMGYIIITAWGDEANDELVANQNLN